MGLALEVVGPQIVLRLEVSNLQGSHGNVYHDYKSMGTPVDSMTIIIILLILIIDIETSQKFLSLGLSAEYARFTKLFYNRLMNTFFTSVKFYFKLYFL